MASEKEINVNLFERLHIIQRIRKAAKADNATIQDVLAVLDEEEGYIREMLYQKPPLYDNDDA